MDCIYLDRDTDKQMAGFCEGSISPSENEISRISRITKTLPDCKKKKDCALWH